jgi:hypothetical protein
MHPLRPLGPAHATSPSSRRPLRQLAGQGGLPQIANRSRSALEKANNRRSDNLTKVIRRRHAIYPTANSQVEELSMEAPRDFQFGWRQRAGRLLRNTSRSPQLQPNRLDDLLLKKIEVTLADADASQACEHEDPDPVVSEDSGEIRLIKLDQPSLQGPRGVLENRLPFGLPAAEIDLLVHPLDQRFLRQTPGRASQ